jgi:LAS superfamily LD-carboxypeptidase LdcB
MLLPLVNAKLKANMFSLLLLLSINTGSFQQAQSKLPEQLGPVSTQVQTIEQETCLKTSLRQFDLMELEGTKLNKFIYLQTKQVLKEAREAGYPLSLTSAHRTCQEQTQLRNQNCLSPTSAVETCSPPTEKPGDSLHNYGMAVDFKCDGYPIFGNSPCYTWLKEKAPKFKLKQRVEEPWHWSLTGR